ncbi:MAG TPA: Do family serine endopeptidase [Gammaproteobacteria bacterium]|nr:Do family serine endopeptidase [Gammaproteobacteria bacterium]
MNRIRRRLEPLWAASVLAAAVAAAPAFGQTPAAGARAPAAQDAQSGAARENGAHQEHGADRESAANPFLGPHPTLAPLLRAVTPAVVNISVASPAAPAAPEGGTPQPDERQHPFLDVPEQGPQQSVGSGVIVDARRGLIVTNAHVVSQGPDIVVTLADRRRLKGTLVGSDEATDIAVLSVDAPSLTAVRYGDSTKLEVGDFVVAIGNPFGLGQTATLGIVSALGRGLDIEGYEDFIQTDASINPGNSGGALLDLDGRLMGMNTAIVSPGGGNVGIGFAIPAEMVQSVVTQLVEHGEVRRGRLGVFIQDVTPGLAEALELGADRGALVTEIEPGSSAATARIEVGDVVTAVDGKRVETATELRNSIGLMPLGATVELTLLRNGQTRTQEVRIGEPQPQLSGLEIEQIPGAEFADVSPGEDTRAGAAQGARVTAVQPGSAAERIGLKANDVVTAVNRKSVSSVEELAAAIADAGDTVALRVERDGRPAYVLIQ